MAMRHLLAVVAMATCLTACLDRTRVNTLCQWNPETARPLDLNDWPQQRHLYEDVAIAEELAIQYADAVHKERFGFQGHGGLIEGGRLRDRCMASLVAAIATTHGITVERVEQARARGYRDIRWDIGVLVAFLGFYLVAAWAIVGAISRRFPIDQGLFAAAMPFVASLPVGTAAFQLLTLWGAALEIVRIGNGHISSYRSAKPFMSQQKGELWLATIAIFLLVAALHLVLTRREGRATVAESRVSSTQSPP